MPFCCNYKLLKGGFTKGFKKWGKFWMLLCIICLLYGFIKIENGCLMDGYFFWAKQ
jgi:hypothetical protein